MTVVKFKKRYNKQKAAIRQKVASILRKAEQSSPPVDLVALAKLQRIRTIDLRPMLADASIDVALKGFKIVIQHNRFQSFDLEAESDLGRLTARQRFSLAHEIAHTFFYDLSRDPPVLSKTAPNLPILESLCQYGAGQMLVPEGLLIQQLRQSEPLSYHLVVKVAKRFGVSSEAAIRRLDELDSMKSPYRAVILASLDQSGQDAQIKAACYHPSLLPCLPRPELYSDLRRWCGNILEEEFWLLPSWDQCVRLKTGKLLMKKRTPASHKGSFFLEVELSPST